jgi:5-methylcytosine-specific restriction endonuclease McrA
MSVLKLRTCKCCGETKAWKDEHATCGKCLYRKWKEVQPKKFCPCGAEVTRFKARLCEACAQQCRQKARQRQIDRQKRLWATSDEFRAKVRQWGDARKEKKKLQTQYRTAMARVSGLKPLCSEPFSQSILVLGIRFKLRIPKLRPHLTVAERERRRIERERIRNQRKSARRRGAAGSIKTGDIRFLFAAQKGRCFYCTKKLKDYHVDHFVPLARGGTNYRANLRLACPDCNLAKSDKLPEQFLGVMIV